MKRSQTDLITLDLLAVNAAEPIIKLAVQEAVIQRRIQQILDDATEQDRFRLIAILAAFQMRWQPRFPG